MFFLRPLGQFKHRFRLLLQDKQEMQSICNTCSTHHSMGWGTPATQAAQSVPLYSTPWSPGSASYTGATRRHLRKNTAQTLWDTKLEQLTKKNGVRIQKCVDLEQSGWHAAGRWSRWAIQRGACRTAPSGWPASPPPKSCSTSPSPSTLSQEQMRTNQTHFFWLKLKMENIIVSKNRVNFTKPHLL